MELSKLQRYLSLRSKQMRLDLEAATLFKSGTEVGDVPEDSVRRFLNSSLPARYTVGLGEVISTSEGSRQTNAKDVIIFDADLSPVLGWGETGSQLFPIESVYAVIEVKKTIDSTSLLKGMEQAVEARRLNSGDSRRPFTALIAFGSNTETETLARTMSDLPIDKRVDFVLVLEPFGGKGKNMMAEETPQSDYIAHWFYETPGVGGGPVRFVSADEAYRERQPAQDARHVYLTWARSEDALLWFYLFLISSINAMERQTPDLWKYAQANGVNLGYAGNPSR